MGIPAFEILRDVESMAMIRDLRRTDDDVDDKAADVGVGTERGAVERRRQHDDTRHGVHSHLLARRPQPETHSSYHFRRVGGRQPGIDFDVTCHAQSYKTND